MTTEQRVGKSRNRRGRRSMLKLKERGSVKWMEKRNEKMEKRTNVVTYRMEMRRLEKERLTKVNQNLRISNVLTPSSDGMLAGLMSFMTLGLLGKKKNKLFYNPIAGKQKGFFRRGGK